MGNDHNLGSNRLKIKEKIKRWREEKDIHPPAKDKSRTAFDHAVHKLEDHKTVYLSKGSVREVFTCLVQEYITAEEEYLARTVGEITEKVDYGQSTVSKAVQDLEEGLVIARLPHAYSRDNVLALIPPIATHLHEGMKEFERTANLPSPPANSRAAGIIAAHERDSSSEDPWEVRNNLELWYHGELMGLAPKRDLSIRASQTGKGLLEVSVQPLQGKISDESWKYIKKNGKALTQGLASMIKYNHKTGEYPSFTEVGSNVFTLEDCQCKIAPCAHWIVGVMDPKY